MSSILLSSGISVEPWQQILVVKAINGRTERAFNDEHNLLRHPERQPSPGYSEREVTPSTRASSPVDDDDVQLVLSFSNPPKDIATGFILGSDRTKSDIIIGSRKDGISSRHFVINFDERGRIVMRDISKKGSYVSYNRQPYNHRAPFIWMLPPGYKVAVSIKERRIEFSIDVPTHTGHLEQYGAHLTRYLDLSSRAVPSFANLLIASSASTATTITPQSAVLDSQTTNSQATNTGPVFVLDVKIGSGQFGQVFKVFNASTWQVYAAKDIQPKYMASEVLTLEKLSHENIVRYISFFETGPRKLLVMEYCPLGDLQDQFSQSPFSKLEVLTILLQGLQALLYLHNHDPGIVHRDIKPANILVKCRQPSLIIGLADFGLSNASGETFLETFCGTLTYAAPEIYEGTHWSPVDVWSLAVVALEYSHGLPSLADAPGNMYSPWYAERVARKVIALALKNPEDMLVDLLHQMLQLDPWERPTAAECLPYAEGLKETEFVFGSILLQGPAQDYDPTNLFPSSEIRKCLSAADVEETPSIGGDGGLEVIEATADPQAPGKRRRSARHSTPSSGRRSRRQAVADSGEAEMAALILQYLRK